MATVTINGKQYETDLGPDGEYLTPPKLISPPSTVSVDLLHLLSSGLFADRVVLKDWIAGNVFVSSLLARQDSIFTLPDLDNFKVLVEEDRDDVGSPLTAEVGNKVVALVDQLRASLGGA